MKRNPDSNDLKLPPMSRGMLAFTMILIFATGVAVTAFVLKDPLGLLGQSVETVTAAQESPGVSGALYQCPMHPEVIDHEPSDCPICGMKLTEMDSLSAAATGAAPDSTTITIDPVQVQNTGVVSVAASVEDIARKVRTVGILDFNADRIKWVNTKYSGWIEKVHVSYVGQEVRRGDPLFDIYSPELVTTQEEYLRALDYRRALADSGRAEALQQAESLLRSTRERLEYWDISEDQIRQLESDGTASRRLTVRSPADGVVAEIMDEALEGMFVTAGKNLYKIADLETLWVHADVYESDLPWVHERQQAEVSFRNDPKATYRGKILFLYPEVSKETRTLKICVEVPNARRRLRAGMYADVTLHGPKLENAVLISSASVLRTGERDIVFVDLGEGRFVPREVELGVRADGNRIQVVNGVSEGESVVTQAQFMLDSESHVMEAIAKFLDRRGEAATNEGHAP